MAKAGPSGAGADEVKAGTVLGHYRIESLLGHGAMGSTYRARDTRRDVDVAFKLLPEAFSGSRAMELFRREGRVIAQLVHRHLVPFADGGRTQRGRFYVVTNLAVNRDEPTSLADEAERMGGRVPWQRLCLILVQVLDALGYVHEKGVVHGDLKPSNILLGPDRGDRPTALVSDINMLNVLGRDYVRTRIAEAKAARDSGAELDAGTRSALNTRRYMSPELNSGDTPPDGRSDLYALGAVVLKALTGHEPRGQIKMPTTVDPSLPRFWDQLVGKALQPVPEDRFQSADEMKQFLEEVVDQAEPGLLGGAPKPPPGAKLAAEAAAKPNGEAAAGAVQGLAVVSTYTGEPQDVKPPSAAAEALRRISPWQWLTGIGFVATLVAAGLLAPWRFAGSYLVSFGMLTVCLSVIVESARKYFYDDPASMVLKSVLAAAILSLPVIFFPVTGETMMDWTSLFVHPVCWVLVVRFVYLMETGHALLVGLASGAVLNPLVTITYGYFFPDMLPLVSQIPQ